LKKDVYRLAAVIAATLLIGYVWLSSPAPYVVQKPGHAADVGPMVAARNPDVREGSVIMLTTVRQQYPNWATYIAARFHPEWDVYRQHDIFQEGETQSEYVARQRYVMKNSHSNAMQAAYRALDIPYEILPAGVIVTGTVAGMPAEKVLRAGDRIVEVDGRPVSAGDELAEYVRGMEAGKTVRIAFERGGERQDAEVEIGDFGNLPAEPSAPPRSGPGLGVLMMTLLEVKALDPERQVEISVDEIGGPSAGLIFALEVVDQLTPGDLTRGYRIAGTGTIDAEGRVGPVGGVRHKVVAAAQEQADLFFVPKANEEEARTKAEQIGAGMTVVAVGTLQDALEVLERLPAKTPELTRNQPA